MFNRFAVRKVGTIRIPTIERPSIVDSIIGHIKGLLLTGELRPGQKLPSEQEMVEQFEVSRSSVREAMKMLAALGVVEIRRGDGTYIARKVSSQTLNSLAFAILIHTGTSKEILELREMIEIGYCELAALKATEDDFEKLEKSLQEWKEYAASEQVDLKRLAQLDLKFHHTIIEIAQNPLISKIASTVEDLFFASIQRSLEASGGFERALKGHIAILAALRSKEPHQVREAVKESLAHWYIQLEARG